MYVQWIQLMVIEIHGMYKKFNIQWVASFEKSLSIIWLHKKAAMHIYAGT